jgi:hypothetical protein
MARMFWLAWVVALCGCGGDDQKGIVLVSWTVRGAPASDAACQGISHLTLEIAPEVENGVVIEPIPCALGKLRYDHLPQGLAAVRLDGVDATDQVIVTGIGNFDLEPNPSAPPLQLDLR